MLSAALNNDRMWSSSFLLAIAIKASLSLSSSSLCHHCDKDGSPTPLLHNGIDVGGQPHGQVPPLSVVAMTTPTGAKKTKLWSSLFLLPLAIAASLLLLLLLLSSSSLLLHSFGQDHEEEDLVVVIVLAQAGKHGVVIIVVVIAALRLL
jgi:hypothetical protein